MAVADRTPPTGEEFLAYRERFCNWGRWGPDDQLGTLNHITPEVRRAAAGLVRAGRSVSLSRPIATRPASLAPLPAQHYVTFNPGGSGDYIGLYFHGRTNTHIDALCHIFTIDDLMYGGRPASEVTSTGALSNSVDRWRSGIVTRGVLYDVARVRGTDYVDPESPVQAWDLEDAAKAQAIEPRAGDAVFVRCGYGPYVQANPDVRLQSDPSEYFRRDERVRVPGVGASVAEFLYEHDAALLGWDFLDAPEQGLPPTRPPKDNPTRSIPVHEIAIPMMGLPLVDNCDLEELADTCAALGRYDFMLTIAPLVVVGGTGSPVNPLAVF